MKFAAKLMLIITIIFSLSILFMGCNLPIDIPTDEKFDNTGWQVTFFDDFNQDKLDLTRWRIFTGERPTNPHPRHIHRACYYSNDEDIVFLKDGNLHISTKYKNGQYGEGWYSSWLETTTGDRGRAYEPTPDDYIGFAQKFGYFEIRCIAPPAQGLWSAFWLLPNEGTALGHNDKQGTAEDGCEVDIMESPFYFQNKEIVQPVIHCDYGTGNGAKSDKAPMFKVPNMYEEFHTYAVEWNEDTYTFYIDGYKVYSTKNVVNDKVLGTSKVNESLLLSVEVAGHSKDGVLYTGIEKDGKKSWCGNIANMDKTKAYDFIVDYVKVMQKA